MRQLFRKYPLSRALPAVAAAAVSFALAPLDTASAAYTYKSLHSFCRQTHCPDGMAPTDRLALGRDGILYGTAQQGGKYNRGVVFELVPNRNKTAYKQYVLHNFCASRDCADGYYPIAGVILDLDGNAYGTASSSPGTIFKLTHGSKGWTFGVLKTFCQDGGNNCTDGAVPLTGLSYAGQDAGEAWDGSSPLFGTTDAGGAYGNGVAYELAPSGSSWNYTVIHNFQTSSHANEVIVDSAGNIYGTTQQGGKNGGGLMYKLASGTWSETVLHDFCNSGNCDGNEPLGRLFMDASGNLFGTTFKGGNSNNLCNGTCGLVFKRASGGTYSVLYNFCSRTDCIDGASPGAGVIIDGSGNLFGTTFDGGAGDLQYGVVYEISGGTESVLYSFCINQTCTDGANPAAGLIQDSTGGLVGTTFDGGAYNELGGTVFRVGP